MNADESNIWHIFCIEVESNCKRMKIPKAHKNTISEHLAPQFTYAFSRGYHSKLGYYEIAEGDRGSLSISLATIFKDEAMWHYLKNIASSVGYSLELINRKCYEPMWHYGTERYDSALKTWNENPSGWKYTVRYDGRKYWFEYAISALSNVYDEQHLDDYISECENFMNRWFCDKHWGFDRSIMEFVEESTSLEHD